MRVSRAGSLTFRTRSSDSFLSRLSNRSRGFDSFSVTLFLASAPTTKPFGLVARRRRGKSETRHVARAESFPETVKPFRLPTTTASGPFHAIRRVATVILTRILAPNARRRTACAGLVWEELPARLEAVTLQR